MVTQGLNSRQLAFQALREVQGKGAYTDIALDRQLKVGEISNADRALVCELVYGCVRLRRSLDYLIDHLGKKPALKQPPDLRLILHIGLYQLRYLNQIPPSAAVNTTVELAKKNGLKALAPVVNGMLRKYERMSQQSDPLSLLKNNIKNLGVLYSFPDWIVAIWLEQLTNQETQQLCEWFNQPPKLDLRVNPLQASVEEVESALKAQGIAVSRLTHLPQALRLSGSPGFIPKLPGFLSGWWMVQDSSAQLVTHVLSPQPGEVVIDACAAPGGKTTHMAELMGDQGEIWAGDRSLRRLRKVSENAERLKLKSIAICDEDRLLREFKDKADRVLVDAPCSGLGTLHKHPDIRWRQTEEGIKELSHLQGEILSKAATWVKPDGVMVYSTCTLSPQENEQVVKNFLTDNPSWQIEPPLPNSAGYGFANEEGLIKVWPHKHDMDGFFMVKLKKGH